MSNVGNERLQEGLQELRETSGEAIQKVAEAAGATNYNVVIQLLDGEGSVLGDAFPQTKAGLVLFSDGENLEKKMDDLLYEAIQLTSFSVNPTTAEMGSTVNTVTLSWDYNKKPKTLTLDGSEIDVSLKTKTISSAGVKANKTYTLKATDDRNASAQKTASIAFLNGVYWGKGASRSSFDSTFILGLTKGLQSSRAKTFSVNAGASEHIYYAFPTRFGTPVFKVGGFEGGFGKAATIEFTNASGYKESYDIWKSDNAGLGNTTVEVK